MGDLTIVTNDRDPVAIQRAHTSNAGADDGPAPPDQGL
jgi:hypothetical protein